VASWGKVGKGATARCGQIDIEGYVTTKGGVAGTEGELKHKATLWIRNRGVVVTGSERKGEFFNMVGAVVSLRCIRTGDSVVRGGWATLPV